MLAPRFLVGPTASATSDTIAWVRFTTDVPVRCRVSFSGPASGRVEPTSEGTQREVLLAGLAPGAEHEVLVEIADASALERIASASTRVTTPPAAPRRRVLFDAAHGEDAGNADWVVDEPGLRAPTPAEPSGPDDWSGAISSFAYGLWATGRYEIASLPAGVRLSEAELAGVRVVVLPEANSALSAAELTALWTFVRGGGGLLLLGNHSGSDRDFDGLDGAEVADRVLAGAPEAGIRVLPADIERVDPTVAFGTHPVLAGPFGAVRALSFFDATTLTVSDPAVALASARAGEPPLAAAAIVGQGRVVVAGDSAGLDDGTGHAGNQLFDGWSDYDNARFYLNAVSWLAGEY